MAVQTIELARKGEVVVENNAAPLSVKATVLSFTVGPGETMFIPNGWWHTTVSKTVTISVALDQLCRSNWARFRNKVQAEFAHAHPVKQAAAQAFLRARGPLRAGTLRADGLMRSVGGQTL